MKICLLNSLILLSHCLAASTSETSVSLATGGFNNCELVRVTKEFETCSSLILSTTETTDEGEFPIIDLARLLFLNPELERGPLNNSCAGLLPVGTRLCLKSEKAGNAPTLICPGGEKRELSKYAEDECKCSTRDVHNNTYDPFTNMCGPEPPSPAVRNSCPYPRVIQFRKSALQNLCVTCPGKATKEHGYSTCLCGKSEFYHPQSNTCRTS